MTSCYLTTLITKLTLLHSEGDREERALRVGESRREVSRVWVIGAKELKGGLLRGRALRMKESIGGVLRVKVNGNVGKVFNAKYLFHCAVYYCFIGIDKFNSLEKNSFFLSES